MIHPEPKSNKGDLPSPVAGMSMGQWLGKARSAEKHLETLLERDDLTLQQREQIGELLEKVRSVLAVQLERINGAKITFAFKH